MEEVKHRQDVGNPTRHTIMADLHTWKLEARNRRLTFLSSKTWISNVKYFFRFLTIITKNGSFIPSVAAGSAGHVMNVDWIFDPIISSTLDCMSSSCGRLIWPFTTTNHKYKKNGYYHQANHRYVKISSQLIETINITKKQHKRTDQWTESEQIIRKIT